MVKRSNIQRVLFALMAIVVMLTAYTITAFADEEPVVEEAAEEAVEAVTTVSESAEAETFTVTTELTGIDIPEDFVQPDVKLFLADVYNDTVVTVDFFKDAGYVATMELQEGYYVLFDNDIGWESQSGKQYSFGQFSPFYVGHHYDANEFEGIVFPDITDELVVEVIFTETSYSQTIGPDSTFIPTEEQLTMQEWLDFDYKTLMLRSGESEEATPMPVVEEAAPEEEVVVATSQPVVVAESEEESYGETMGNLALSVFTENKLLWAALLVAVIVLAVCIIRRKSIEKKQQTSDKKDPSAID